MSIPAILASQRTHVLFVLSEPTGDPENFLAWFGGAYAAQVAALEGVLDSRYFQVSDVDVTHGRYQELPFRFLAVHDLSFDGAERAAPVIDSIVAAHEGSGLAGRPGTWLSYPTGELAGTEQRDAPYVTLAFANGYPGQEEGFREWYPTRHIRHALNIPALVSGRCHARTGFQHETAEALDFQIVAIYEQAGEPEDFLEQIASVPPGSLSFPAMDTSRFAEACYRRLT